MNQDGVLGFERKNEANIKHKDSVFRQLFNEKERAIELYNALAGTNYDMNTDLKFTTLNPAAFMGIKNDVAFMMDNKLIVFIEHQSAWSPNMPIRSLIYAGETFSILYNDISLYARTAKIIPVPEFYVLYNGNDKKETPEYLRLSDLFAGKASENSIELVVKVVNICYNEKEEIFKKSRVLYEYSRFVWIVKKHKAITNDLTEAMRHAVQECIENGILVEYLREQGVDELSALYREFTMEEFGDMREQEGVELKSIEVARMMKEDGESIEKIVKYSGLAEEEIEAL